MRKMKIKLVAIALFAVVLSMCFQQSLAFYSTVGKTTNVVTSGDIELVIHETTDQGTEFPKEGVVVLPGDIVSKQVSVENVSEHPFYLRVKLVYGINSDTLSEEECFKLNIDEENWKYEDGWYYYQGVVEPGEETPYVFSKVEIIGDKVDNNYIGKTLSINVIAHAVQAENNVITDNDVSTAQGWPME